MNKGDKTIEVLSFFRQANDVSLPDKANKKNKNVRSIYGKGVTIENNTEVINTILFNNVRVKENSKLKDCIALENIEVTGAHG